MTAALANADPAGLKSGNAIYLDIFRAWLPRLPMTWALPLSVAALLAIALAGWLTPRERRVPRRPIAPGLAPVLLLALCVAVGFVLYTLAAWTGRDLSLLHSAWLRWSLAFGVWSAALLTARWAGGIACWLWFAGLAVVTAIWLPGFSPYFLFPALVAAPLLLLTLRGGRALAYLLSALVALAVWVPFNSGTEDIGGLALHPLFMVTAVFAVLPLLPLMAGRRTALPALASFGLALLLAVIAGFSAA
jgi:hypothetical protein